MSIRWAASAAAMVAAAVVGGGALACAPGDELLARASLQAHLQGTRIDSVKCAAMDGLFEVVTGRNVFYTDREGKRILVGSMFDLVTQRDLTQPVLASLRGEAGAPAGADGRAVERSGPPALEKVSWSELPDKLALVRNRGGKIKVAVFADPNCPHCRDLHTALAQLPEVEVHEFLWPVFSPTRDEAPMIVCAADPGAALDGAYAGRKLSPPKGKCSLEGEQQISAFAHAHGWEGTPVIIRADGTVQAGFFNLAQLQKWLGDVKEAGHGG